ncbi:hypothetical protein [Planococcus lenghuensis]|uniref:Uncharacterized protein n=1 Tax=Planococcus lenghuensis TaxID=2213202 RepID=A0A1Q2L4J9_9BACL|nr:hypothetical protein [Planococcus lenghuensis]AQQ55385.1 hypothetical protein B0X71_19640 [Planococcus lenghuensis]
MGSVISFMVFLPTICLGATYGLIVGISGLNQRNKGEEKGLLLTSVLCLTYLTPLVSVIIGVFPLIAAVILMKKGYKRFSHS